MRIEQLEQFITVVDEGSMSEAARKLFVSRSSLSTAMKNLENDLGAPLFERVSKGVLLTQFGVNAYNQARDICGRIDHLKQSTIKRPDRSLSIASLYCPVANDAFAELFMRHSEDSVELNIEETGVTEVIQSVAEGFAEIGVFTIFPISMPMVNLMLENSNVEYHEIETKTLCAIVGPENPLYHSKQETVTLEELGIYTHVEHYSAPTHHTMGYDFGYESTGYRSDIKVGDLGLARYLVANSSAVLVNSVSKSAFQKLYADYNCRCIPLADESKHVKIGWIKLAHRELSTLAKEYIDIFAEKAHREYGNQK